MDPIKPASWPPGWSRDRLVNASSSEILDLPENEKDRMFDSLREILGPEGFKALLHEMSTNYEARLAAEAGDEQEPELPAHLRAPFLATLQQLYLEGGMGQWGFVVYRLVYDDEGQWAAFRNKWDEIMKDLLQFYDDVPRVADAMQHLEFRWNEDRELEGASFGSIASHYRDLLAQQQPLPSDLAHPLCLAITSASLSSTLSCPLPSSAPRPRSDRKSIPFAVAIAKWLDAQSPSDLAVQMEETQTELEDLAPQTFNVAVESLLDELFPVVGEDIMSLDELAVGLGPKKVWVSGGRYGIHEMKE